MMANPQPLCSHPPCSPPTLSQFYPSLCKNKPCPPLYPFPINPYASSQTASYPSWPSNAPVSPYASLPFYPSISSFTPSRPSGPSSFPFYDPAAQTPSSLDYSSTVKPIQVKTTPEETDISNESLI